MTITAKYAATCSTCRQTISPGAKIEWIKGSPVRHTTCAAGPSVAASRLVTSARAAGMSVRYASRPSCGGTRTGCSCGSVTEFSKNSDCWTCRHDAE